MKRRTMIIAAIAVVAIIAAVLVVRDWVLPTFTTVSATGVPTAVNPFAATKSGSFAPASGNSGVQRVAFAMPVASPKLQQSDLYVSCTADRGTTPTPTGLPATTAPDGTPTVTPEAAATEAAPSTAADPIVVRIIGAESEACYQVGEVFFDNNEFNLAVGVTKTIDGFVQIDRANVANSQLGEIVINISEFTSDNARRDGIIRQRWLESNTYPLAKLTEAKLVGLPARAYQDGEVLAFQIVGQLEVHGTKVETTFNMQGSLTGDTLVVTGYADINMNDFGFEAPEVGGMLKANPEARLILNLVARPEA